MNNFRVPPSPTWYIPPVCSPDNGLLYIAGNHTSITYIPPVQSENSTKSNAAADTQNVQNIQTIQTHNQLVSCIFFFSFQILFCFVCFMNINRY